MRPFGLPIGWWKKDTQRLHTLGVYLEERARATIARYCHHTIQFVLRKDSPSSDGASYPAHGQHISPESERYILFPTIVPDLFETAGQNALEVLVDLGLVPEETL